MATRFHNPLKLRLNHRGEMVDKYGRIFTYSPELHKQRRKDRAPQNVSQSNQTKETGPIGKIFEAEKKKREQIPQPDSWWVRRCNGKRYYLQDAPKMFFGKLMVWIYEEGKNRVLHIPVATLLKRYDQYTGAHKTVCDITIIKD